MSAGSKFDVKVVTCEPDEMIDRIQELETQWLVSLLRRSGIPKFMMDKVLNEKYSISAWRDFLLESKGLIIQKNLNTKVVEVYKLDSDTFKQVKVGQWKWPIISRVSNGGKVRCELQLKYWQIM